MNKLLLCSLVLAAPAFAQQFKPGSPVTDFDIANLKGEQVKYSALKGDTTVVIFISTACPISNGYNDRMKAVYNDYSAKGGFHLGVATLGRRSSHRDEGAAGLLRCGRTSSDRSPRSSRWL